MTWLIVSFGNSAVATELEKVSIHSNIKERQCQRTFKLPHILTNLDSILQGRDFTLSTKVHLVKAMTFAVVMYGCDSKKKEYKES